jgi:hypothetical protein
MKIFSVRMEKDFNSSGQEYTKPEIKCSVYWVAGYKFQERDTRGRLRDAGYVIEIFNFLT